MNVHPCVCNLSDNQYKHIMLDKIWFVVCALCLPAHISVCIIYKGHKQLVLEGVTSFFNDLDETCRKENKEDRLVICESYCFLFIDFCL